MSCLFMLLLPLAYLIEHTERSGRNEQLYTIKKKKKLICTMFYNKAVARAKTMDMGNVHMLGGLICVSHCS